MKVEIKSEETRCDRCRRRVSKHRQPVTLTTVGVEEAPKQAADVKASLELCLPCEDSLTKWWARKADERDEAAE
jgi:hypothetical protein